MAKIQSLFKISGPVGDASFYENEYGQQMKLKGGPTNWQVKNLDRFDQTRRNAAEWKRATAASKLFRIAMGNLLDSVNNIRLSGRMNGPLLKAIQGDPVHDYGERVISSGDLSVLSGFEFNYNLSLDNALPLNIENCFSLEAGKLSMHVPAFRIRKKKGLPKDATHYRLVSCMLSIDFEQRKHYKDLRVSELHAMGRKAGGAFSIEQLVQPVNDQGCFWLMGIEFYKLVDEQPVLVRGGALRVMQWVGKARVEEKVLAETGVEGIDVAYQENIEEVFAAAYVEGAKFVEALTDFAGGDDVAVLTEVEGSSDPEKLVVDEVDVVLEDDATGFEKSLQVVLPIAGYQRQGIKGVDVMTDRLYTFDKLNI